MLAGFPVLCIQGATRPTATSALDVVSRSGLVMSPAGSGADPVVAVRLPNAAAPTIVIEMPEHAWGRRPDSSDQEWFYRLYSSDARLRTRVTWTRKDRSLEYSVALLHGVRLHGKARLDDDGITVAHEFENGGDARFEQVQAPVCVKLYAPFTDVFLERTYVHHHEGLDLLASETPKRLHMNAEEWLPSRYVARCAPPAVLPEHHIERQPGGIVKYQKLRLADVPFIATSSSPAGWVAATHALDAPSVWTNPARNCHHVDVSSPLPPGGRAALSLKVYLMRGTVDAAWKAALRNRAKGRA